MSQHAPHRLSPRTWFRARLDRDPRRWVLALAASEGLVAFADRLQGRRETFLGWGAGLAVALGLLAITPALGVLAMVVHGRLLHWTGRPLGGRAEPRQIHAAFAWALLPVLAVGWPLALEFPLRAVAVESDPVSPGLERVLELSRAAAGPLQIVAAGAAVLGVFLYVKFLAEAQAFSSWRALANQLLALALGASILLVGSVVGWLTSRTGNVLVAAGTSVALLLALEIASRRFSARPAGAA
jgi:hypothetical protein